MVRTAVVPFLLVGVLAGCATATGGTATTPAETPSATPVPTTTTSTTAAAPVTTPPKPAAANGTDVHACLGGTCEIAVSAPVSFPVSAPVGVSTVSVTKIEPNAVTVNASGPGVSLQVGVTIGSTDYLNSLSVHVVSITDGTAVVDFAPRR